MLNKRFKENPNMPMPKKKENTPKPYKILLKTAMLDKVAVQCVVFYKKRGHKWHNKNLHTCQGSRKLLEFPLIYKIRISQQII